MGQRVRVRRLGMDECVVWWTVLRAVLSRKLGGLISCD